MRDRVDEFPRKGGSHKRGSYRLEPGQSLAPTHKSTESSEMRNDLVMVDAIVIDGISGFVEASTPNKFAIDFPQFSSLLRASYDAQNMG